MHLFKFPGSGRFIDQLLEIEFYSLMFSFERTIERNQTFVKKMGKENTLPFTTERDACN